MKHRILFFGTSEFAVPPLEALAKDARFEIVGVVTQPDRAVGRHATITPPPVKQKAIELGLSPIIQPEKIKDDDFQNWIKQIGLSCQAFVVVSYGKILPQWLLDLPEKGVVNVHGSLLPRWRGASPIQAAIAAGDKTSGVTIMKIDAEMDHGPVLAKSEEPILETDTGEALHDRLAALGGAILPDILTGYLDGTIEPQEQDHDLATHCRTLTRDDGKLDFSKTSEELERLVRAFTPWPGTWMEWNGKRMKILETKIGKSCEKNPGEFFVEENMLMLACANNTSLAVIRLQLEGKNPTSGQAFAQNLD